MARTAFDHAPQIQVRQVHHSMAVDLNHRKLPVQLAREEFPIGAQAGIVHQHIDHKVTFLGKRENPMRRLGIAKVRRNAMRLDSIAGLERIAELVQTIRSSRS